MCKGGAEARRQQCNDNCCSNPRRLAKTSVALEGRNSTSLYTLYMSCFEGRLGMAFVVQHNYLLESKNEFQFNIHSFVTYKTHYNSLL